MNENTAEPHHSYEDFISILESDSSWREQRQLTQAFESSFATQAAYRMECRKRKIAFGEGGLQVVNVEDLVLGRNVVAFAASALKRWNKCLGACGDIALISDQAIEERIFPFSLCPWNLATKFHESMCDWASKQGVELPLRDESGRPVHFIYGVESLEEDFPNGIPLWATPVPCESEPLSSSMVVNERA